MSIGKLEEFDIENGNWRIYKERLEQYFLVNGVKEELKVSTLILVIGHAAYELLVDLCAPLTPIEKSYTELVDILGRHVQPQPSTIAERYKFRQRRQEQTETIAKFFATLKKMSRYCEFGCTLNENLRDQLVCGIRCEYTRQTLFTYENLTMEKAVEIAVNMENAGKSSQLVYKKCVDDNAVGATSQVNAVGVTRGQCLVCGKYGHIAKVCWYKEWTCRNCKNTGHLQKMCQKKNATKISNRRVHYVEPENNEQHGRGDMYTRNNSSETINKNTMAGSGEGMVYCINKFQCEPITTVVNIEGYPITMEVDTGSAISCINEKLYNSKFKTLELKPSELVLRYYTGETLKPLGYIEPMVKTEVNQERLQLFVIRGGKTALLGRSWLCTLQIRIPKFQGINNVENVNNNKLFNLNSFIDRYADVFSDGLGRFKGGCVRLHVRPEATPMFLRARHMPFALKEKVDKELQLMLKDGIIEPVDTAEWATPIVPIIKPNGRIRICADYKVTLNPVLQIDHFPLPTVDELMSQFPKGQKFSKIDLAQAYLQLCLDEESKALTVINTHKGLFRFNRLVFGLASSPAIFQRTMSQLFEHMENVALFLDDILISGKDDQEHLNTLHRVFDKLNQYGLKVNKDKCCFFQDKVEYLGYIISAKGVSTNSNKVEAILKMNAPKDVSELRAFLGMVNYYAKFVCDLSTVLAPLYELLKQNVTWQWSPACELAFKSVKKLLSDAPVLMHFDNDLPIVLTCDASSKGLGAILSHKVLSGDERPIAFASRVLNTAEKHYSQIDKEALSIIFGVKKFHQFLYGKKFILKTDHKPLLAIFGPKKGIPIMAASRLQRWSVIMAAYNFDIVYVNSNKNSADVFSRLPVGEVKDNDEVEFSYINFIEQDLPLNSQDIKIETEKDPVLGRIINYVINGWPSVVPEDLKTYFNRKEQLYIESGCLFWGYKIVVPTKLREKVLKELHRTHLGIVKTKSLARSYVWWPGLDKDIDRICHDCVTCIYENAAPPRTPPQAWQMPSQPWQRLHIDLLGPIEGHIFFVIVDATSKWIEIFKLGRSNATAIIHHLRETFARFGLPRQVVSDNGPPFTSSEFKSFMDVNGIRHTFSAIYHPASNGAAESAVKICKQAIKKAVRDGVDVDAALQRFLLDYRNINHSLTGESPSVILQGRQLRTRLDLLKPNMLERVERVQNKQIEKALGRYRCFELGEKVWVRDFRSNTNPYILGEIVEVVSSRNYVIKVNDMLVNRHIDQLKKYYNTRPNISMEQNETIGQTTNVVAPIIKDNLSGVPHVSAVSAIPSQSVLPPAPSARVVATPALRRTQRTIRPPDRLGYG